MKIYPHIMLKKGDILEIPWEATKHIAVVVWLIDWRLLVESYNNRFFAPRGFFLIKKENYFVPLF